MPNIFPLQVYGWANAPELFLGAYISQIVDKTVNVMWSFIIHTLHRTLVLRSNPKGRVGRNVFARFDEDENFMLSSCWGKCIRGNTWKRTLEELDERVHWLQAPQDAEPRRHLVTTVVSLRVLYKTGNFVTSSETHVFQNNSDPENLMLFLSPKYGWVTAIINF